MKSFIIFSLFISVAFLQNLKSNFESNIDLEKIKGLNQEKKN